MITRLLFAFAAAISVVSPAFADTRPILRVVGDNWCPYNCEPGAPQRGYMVDLLERTLGKSYTIEYSLAPWTRAVESVTSGKNELLVATTPGTTPNFRMSKPLGIDRTCFFVRTGNAWTFRGMPDLETQRIGVIQDYNYDNNGPIDTLIAKYRKVKDSKLETAFGDDALQSNFRKLQIGRMDVVIENDMVGAFTLRKLGLDSVMHQAGCVKGKPGTVHVAVSPLFRGSHAVLEMLDKGVQQMRESKELATLLQGYGMQDWLPVLASGK